MLIGDLPDMIGKPISPILCGRGDSSEADLLCGNIISTAERVHIGGGQRDFQPIPAFEHLGLYIQKI